MWELPPRRKHLSRTSARSWQTHAPSLSCKTPPPRSPRDSDSRLPLLRRLQRSSVSVFMSPLSGLPHPAGSSSLGCERTGRFLHKPIQVQDAQLRLLPLFPPHARSHARQSRGRCGCRKIGFSFFGGGGCSGSLLHLYLYLSPLLWVLFHLLSECVTGGSVLTLGVGVVVVWVQPHVQETNIQSRTRKKPNPQAAICPEGKHSSKGRARPCTCAPAGWKQEMNLCHTLSTRYHEAGE